MTDESDLTKVADPEFLCERRRVRDLLERTPPHEVSPELRVRIKRYDDEFMRRARAAWQHVS